MIYILLSYLGIAALISIVLWHELRADGFIENSDLPYIMLRIMLAGMMWPLLLGYIAWTVIDDIMLQIAARKKNQQQN